ncbi:hypothetical protein ACUNB4_004262 [Vibrio alginolyticus]
MTSTQNASKAKHDAIQQEIAMFEKGKATMIDLMVHNTIALGTTSIDKVSDKLKIPKHKLIDSISSRLFSISGDTIARKV